MHKSERNQTILNGVEMISIMSDRSFPRHSHDEFGFGFIAKGGQFSWSHCGMVEAQAGDTITVNPGEMHDGLGRKDQPRHWRMIFLTPAALAEFGDVDVDRAEFALPVNPSKDTLAQTISVFEAFTFDQTDRNGAEQMLMLALAAHLEGTSVGTTLDVSDRSHAVQIALDMIFQSWADPLSLADFAKATGTSRFQILRRFSREMGTTPHAYLTQHRVKRAKDLILSGTALAETALACGFSDQSHLTRIFSRQFGLTPGRFITQAAS